MTARRRHKPRCAGCGLKPEGCACALLPTLALGTRLAVVQHVRELHKPTNTVRLLAKMLPDLPILPFGMREPAFDPSPLADDVDWHVLFPREDAAVFDDAAVASARAGKLGLVLLDGTWHQCTRMSRRVPRICDLPCMALPAGPASIWTVRTQHEAHGMSTFEAALRVLELVEGTERTAAMREAFALVTARMLFLKGRLSSPDVPAAWNA